MTKKVLITGGAGYVGATLIPMLLSKNYKITIYDLFLYEDNLFKTNYKINCIKGDIRDVNKLSKAMEGQDSIIHLACISNDPSFDLDPKLGREINLNAFEPLVKASKNQGIKRFVNASSSSIYGIQDTKDVHEETPPKPITDYSKFKLECEKILENYSNENFIVSSIRPATVCGYSERQRLDVVVNILTNFAYFKRKMFIFGGEQYRPNIYIKDICRAFIEVLEADENKISKQVFNVGAKNHTLRELAEIVKKVVGDDVNIEYQKSDDIRSYHITSNKIKEMLGFVPNFTIKDAVKSLVNAFEKKLLINTFDDKKYSNIEKMKQLNLK